MFKCHRMRGRWLQTLDCGKCRRKRLTSKQNAHCDLSLENHVAQHLVGVEHQATHNAITQAQVNEASDAAGETEMQLDEHEEHHAHMCGS